MITWAASKFCAQTSQCVAVPHRKHKQDFGSTLLASPIGHATQLPDSEYAECLVILLAYSESEYACLCPGWKHISSSAIYSALSTCFHTWLTLMTSNSLAAKHSACISADFATLFRIQNLSSVVLAWLLLTKPNSSESSPPPKWVGWGVKLYSLTPSESLLTITSHSFHIFVTSKKSV